MAKFREVPELQYDEQNFIRDELKSLLKKNDCVGVRELALEHKKEYPNVLPFLLYHLGEKLYFQGSDEVFPYEFNAYNNLLNIVIPSTIAHIYNNSFSHCDELQYVKILNTDEITVNANAFTYANDVIIYVPKNCNFITTQGKEEKLLDDDSIGVAKESTFENRMNKAIEKWDIGKGEVDCTDILFELIDEHLFNKIRWY